MIEWEPSQEERAANVKLIEKVVEKVADSMQINRPRREDEWIKKGIIYLTSLPLKSAKKA
jgi:hypothetical protein